MSPVPEDLAAGAGRHQYEHEVRLVYLVNLSVLEASACARTLPSPHAGAIERTEDRETTVAALSMPGFGKGTS